MKREVLIYGLILAAAALVARWWWLARHAAPPPKPAASVVPNPAAVSAPPQSGAPATAVPLTRESALSAAPAGPPAGAAATAPGTAPAVTAGAQPVPAASRQPPQAPNPVREEAELIALNLRSFGQRFGGNPVGTNAEIVQTLNGGNPQGVRYLPQEHLRLNEKGELLDAFGTPYFFHQISSLETEIRSAGPDKTLWTADDIAVK